MESLQDASGVLYYLGIGKLMAKTMRKRTLCLLKSDEKTIDLFYILFSYSIVHNLIVFFNFLHFVNNRLFPNINI